MQLVDSKLYVANATRFGTERQHLAAGCGNLISRLKRTSASDRLLAMVLVAFVVTASPALLETVRSTVSLSLQILLQAGHAGLIAFQIFGR
ncbi:MAG TPA: hypothetical protein VN933_02555 [Candidatus Eremiobacteraceae bacterium]|jgi:hypothetical protein|nr:hypothetical protein [Candidatus Eremiobacteraceae bacterium]